MKVDNIRTVFAPQENFAFYKKYCLLLSFSFFLSHHYFTCIFTSFSDYTHIGIIANPIQSLWATPASKKRTKSWGCGVSIHFVSCLPRVLSTSFKYLSCLQSYVKNCICERVCAPHANTSQNPSQTQMLTQIHTFFMHLTPGRHLLLALVTSYCGFLPLPGSYCCSFYLHCVEAAQKVQ